MYKQIVNILTLTLLLALAAAPIALAAGPATVTFSSTDGLAITADLYAPNEDPAAPLIVLFHQARWSRGEYLEIAPRLNGLGFNCLAVDLRSGGEVNGVDNETFKRAEAAGKGTGYTDALPDMEASLAWVRKNHAKGKVIAWGSSYSAALVLRIAGEKPDLADAVLAFAPGEYFSEDGKPETWVADAARKITVPAFITSARAEKPNWAPLFAAIPDGKKASYLPETDGNHGSRALWKEFDDSPGYWEAVSAFLSQFTQK
jgi:dienelactone hydrolase